MMAAAAPVEPAPVPPPAPAPVAPPVLGAADLAASYMTFEQLITERGIPMGSLAELVAGGATVAAVPAPTAYAATAVPALPIVPVESLAPDADVVEVRTLEYQGEAALRRALALKPDLLAAAKNGDPSLHALLHEVIDLVELGLGAGR